MCRVVSRRQFSDNKYSLSAVITVGYTVTDVTASESDGVATLTVVVTLPPEDVPIETFFTLSVNTLDGTATGLQWSLEFDYVLIKLYNKLLTHTHTNSHFIHL